MSTKISLLPDHIANQIAAGEVVQRPACVLRELQANAVDAGATAIKVIIKDAGSTLIHVSDNGHGMNEIDARMCFERHATSKIKVTKDLHALQTLGFRGEALASIAAVAQVELTTREAGEELGTHIVLAASTLHKQVPVTAPQGTSISIKNLFFNVPARRNFLKSPNIEKKHIIDEFQRIALANHNIAFQLYQNTTPIYQLPSQNLAQRIVSLFGKGYKKKLIPCEASTNLIRLHGFIAPPKDAKKTRGEQFFFINNRYVKNSYLQHAVKKAFEGLLPPNTFPLYILYIELPANQIDVNVHPTKTEVKFQEETLVYGIVKTAIQRALANYHITPALDLEQAEGYASLIHPTTSTQQEKNHLLLRSIALEKNIASPLPHPLYKKTKTYHTSPQHLTRPHKTSLTSIPPLQLHDKYIVTQVKSGMLLIDYPAAQERMIYERILAQAKKTAISTQQLLLPTCINLQPADLCLIQDCQQELQNLGFQFITQPPDQLTVTGLPSDISQSSIQSLFEELLEQYKCYTKEINLSKKERWARTLAKRMRGSHLKKLDATVVSSLIDNLFACENPNYTPDGKCIWTILTLTQLSDLLER